LYVYIYTYTYTPTRFFCFKEDPEIAKTTIYWSPEDEVLIKSLREILKREGKSFSEWIRSQARPYVSLHAKGNPQTRIDKISGTGKVLPVCYFHFREKQEEVPAEFWGFKGSMKMLVCKECLRKVSGYKPL